MTWWTDRNREGRGPSRPGPAWKPALPALALAFVFWAAPARAQFGSTGAVQTVSGFKVPDYDENNNLKSILYGDFARVRPDGIIEITNLKIEMYKEGAVEMTVTSPKCIYNQKDSTARSNEDVEILREGLRITGTGFWWNAKQERFGLYSKSRVEIRGVKGSMESGGLP
ncbi:MAG: LPS export ABC transporter periplasmic protein LptC [Kiritimatiellae bacterium]|nr:LPS export ABC transporter periplasmic protein LptC [Kiritimatiellia bacterium]